MNLQDQENAACESRLGYLYSPVISARVSLNLAFTLNNKDFSSHHLCSISWGIQCSSYNNYINWYFTRGGVNRTRSLSTYVHSQQSLISSYTIATYILDTLAICDRPSENRPSSHLGQFLF